MTSLQQRAARIANVIGARYLSFQNPAVVSPPGVIAPQGRRNIIVATPMRSGTHVVIDLLANNFTDYRTRPLYVDLDQRIKQSRSAPDRFGRLDAQSGYIVKTHFPIAVGERSGEREVVAALARDALVIAVRRPDAEIARSLRNWSGSVPAEGAAAREAVIRADIAAFWEMWAQRADLTLEFADLFRDAPVEALLDRVARETGAARRRRLMRPPAQRRLWRIYLNKAMTRLLGRNAPRIDTTIYTLK